MMKNRLNVLWCYNTWHVPLYTITGVVNLNRFLCQIKIGRVTHNTIDKNGIRKKRLYDVKHGLSHELLFGEDRRKSRFVCQ